MRARDRRVLDGGVIAATVSEAVGNSGPTHDDAVTPVLMLAIDSWRPAIAAAETDAYARALEGGAVLVLPRLAFDLEPDERRFLDARWSDGRAKNISLEGDAIKGARGDAADLTALARMVARFALQASGLVTALFPRYAPYLKRARTSYRPHAAAGRAASWRKDDTRLHVDAFPSRPTHGERILRVFCNVNPNGEDRVWRVGERFEPMARRLLPRVRAMLPGEAAFLAALRVTKRPRSPYDHLMLGLHDAAKADREYQARSPQREIRFAPGTTWICYSDQVMHAAASGQFMLEQTTHLPPAALYDAGQSPLAVLARLRGGTLAHRPRSATRGA